MRLALLHPTYWPEVRRGSERLAHDLGAGLAARGHAVRLLTSHRGRPATSVEDGIEVVRAWRPPDGRLRRRLYEEHLTHVPFTYAALRRPLLAIPWASAALPSYGSGARGRVRAVSELPGQAVVDAVEVAGLAIGSARHRTLFL